VGFVVDKVAVGQVSSEYFGFPCHSFHRLLHIHHHPSSGAGTVSQTVADVPSGLSHNPPEETKRKTKTTITETQTTPYCAIQERFLKWSADTNRS
jgi:hypothetical protein